MSVWLGTMIFSVAAFFLGAHCGRYVEKSELRHFRKNMGWCKACDRPIAQTAKGDE